ncbi:MAG: hypothetical protein Kow0099_30410 [Candidatus Abyssubacteria bacterium]
MDIRSGAAFIGCVLVLAAILVSEYGDSFTFYFVGDDFAFVELVSGAKGDILWQSHSDWHYCPLGLLLNALPAAFGVFEPAWYVLTGFVIFLSCAVMVLMLYYEIERDIVGGLAAAVIYVTAIPQAEVIYWKTGNQTSAMALFSLLALLLYIRYVRRGTRLAFVGCIVMYAASMLSIEQGIVTLGIIFGYDLMFHSGPRFREASDSGTRRQLAVSFALRLLILSVVPVSLTVLKAALGFQLSPLTSHPWWAIRFLFKDTLARLVDFNNVLAPAFASRDAFQLAGLLIFFLFFVWTVIRKNASAFFFLVIGSGTMLTISIAAGGPNSRYFCLPLAFFACFLAVFFKGMAGMGVRALEGILPLSGRSAARWLRHLVFWGMCAALAYVGYRGLIARRTYWGLASLIERNIVQGVESYFVSGRVGPHQKVYLLNMPEHFGSEKYPIFYVGSHSLMPDLRHRLGVLSERVELIASGTLFEMTFMGERFMYRALGRDRIVNKGDVKKLIDGGEVVLRFSPDLMGLVETKVGP